jgi:hypothetical protein
MSTVNVAFVGFDLYLWCAIEKAGVLQGFINKFFAD